MVKGQDTVAFLQEGGCHCGTLRYKLTHPPLRTLICHCTDCQRISGSAFGISVVCIADAFTLSGTPKRVGRTLGSGAIGYRSICPECGVWICGDPKLDQSTNINRRIVRGGTFDDTKWIKVDAHIWTRSAQPWVTIPARVPNYPMNESSAPVTNG
jgi:hypothetical protein